MTTDDSLGTEAIAQEKAVLDRLRELRRARDEAHAALRDAIAEQRQAGMEWEVVNDAVDQCPAWCDRSCSTDPVDGTIDHNSALLQLAGPIALVGEIPRRCCTPSSATGPVR